MACLSAFGNRPSLRSTPSTSREPIRACVYSTSSGMPANCTVAVPDVGVKNRANRSQQRDPNNANPVPIEPSPMLKGAAVPGSMVRVYSPPGPRQTNGRSAVCEQACEETRCDQRVGVSSYMSARTSVCAFACVIAAFPVA
ncbi:MAG: hypothetical protein H6815_04730 [Phycisphaeraceae bacterium]|nr:hypothetical protein [Phycisphaerales bacterium]MCB9859739.1 hypothetical protein [Phycisphaeraceae bacterium]